MQIKAEQKTSLSLQIGGVLTLSASAGLGTVNRRSNPNGAEPYSPVTFLGTEITFGPYDDIASFDIRCTAGVINYDATSPPAPNARIFAKSVFSGRQSTIYVPSGTQLTVAANTIGSGMLVPRSLVGNSEPGTPILYTGATLAVSPVAYDRIFTIMCVVGPMAINTAFYSGPLVPVFTTPPSIAPAGGAVGATYTASDGVVMNGSPASRRWLLNGTSIGTGVTVVPATPGTLVLEVTATGPDGSVIGNSDPVTIADITAPVLSNPVDNANGAIGGTISVDTNEANGILYWVVTTSPTPPTVANIKSGTGAVAFGNTAVSSTGTKTFSPTGLTASTTYYAHFVHTDAAGNDSNRASGNGFTTAASGPVPIIMADAQWGVANTATGVATGWTNGAYPLGMGITMTVASSNYTNSGTPS